MPNHDDLAPKPGIPWAHPIFEPNNAGRTLVSHRIEPHNGGARMMLCPARDGARPFAGHMGFALAAVLDTSENEEVGSRGSPGGSLVVRRPPSQLPGPFWAQEG